jgi:hypothetical protein
MAAGSRHCFNGTPDGWVHNGDRPRSTGWRQQCRLFAWHRGATAAIRNLVVWHGHQQGTSAVWRAEVPAASPTVPAPPNGQARGVARGCEHRNHHHLVISAVTGNSADDNNKGVGGLVGTTNGAISAPRVW